MLTASGAELRRARRRVLRAHHPDLGGDPAALRAALGSLGGQNVDGMPRRHDIVFVRRPRGWRRLPAWVAGRRRRARNRRVV